MQVKLNRGLKVKSFFSTVERRSQKAGCEYGPIPSPSFLHPRLRAADQSRQPAIPLPDCERVDSTDVRQQEHDGGM